MMSGIVGLILSFLLKNFFVDSQVPIMAQSKREKRRDRRKGGSDQKILTKEQGQSSHHKQVA